MDVMKTMSTKAMARAIGPMLAGMTAGLAAASCVREYPFTIDEHCANQTGNDWCAVRYGGDAEPRPYCILGNGLCGVTPGRDGCVADEPTDDECYSPCGDSQSAAQNNSCVVGMETTEGTMSTTETTTDEPTASSSESSSTTGPMPCMSDEECTDVTTPYCDTSGVCVPCGQAPAQTDGDAACATAEPSTPVCLAGTCVQCTPENSAACTDMTPVCDEATNTCIACTAHEQCGEAACNLYTGACLPDDAVVHVGGATPDFPNLAMAVVSFAGDGAQGTIIVHDGDYNESLTVDTNRVIAFLAADDAAMPPRWVRNSGDMPQLVVSAGSTVLMDGMQVSSNSSSMTPALRVTGGLAWLDRCRIIQNTGGGILAEMGAELTLRNCFVGGGGDNRPALTLSDSTSNVVYSTFYNSAVAATPALTCPVASTVSIRNSIVVTNGGPAGAEFECAGADVTYSATEAMVAGTGNVPVAPFPDGMPEQWFIDAAGGNFHLQDQGLTVFAGIAQWTTGDPPTDIDGELRPTVHGDPDHAGADAPQ